MFKQFKNEKQQAQTMIPEGPRQSLRPEIKTGKQALAELSDNELECVAGGNAWSSLHSEANEWASHTTQVSTTLLGTVNNNISNIAGAVHR